jgi:23S rRNA pseudouridine1911/1915/1917 synthase
MPTSIEDVPRLGPLTVDEDEAGVRVDAFLARRKLVPSSSAARRAVASGTVRVNHRVAKKGLHLRPGDVVDLEDRGAESVLVPAPQLELSLLYADEDIVAVSKPAGVASHPLRAGEGPTLAGALVARFPECAAASVDAREGGLGHRLDVGTSGVLLAARSRPTWHRLREALAGSHCEKIYLAEIRGPFPSTETGCREFALPGPRANSFVITAPIGRQGRHSSQVVLASGRQPLPARTDVALLVARDGGALVEARLARGRAHQVRAHLAYIGVPVWGDPVYGGAGPADDLHLHAWAVSFLHPTNGKPLRIEAPVPAWVDAYSNWAMLVSTKR